VLAEACAARAAGAQELGPRAWGELVRVQLGLVGVRLGEGAAAPGRARSVTGKGGWRYSM